MLAMTLIRKIIEKIKYGKAIINYNRRNKKYVTISKITYKESKIYKK